MVSRIIIQYMVLTFRLSSQAKATRCARHLHHLAFPVASIENLNELNSDHNTVLRLRINDENSPANISRKFSISTRNSSTDK